MEFMISLVVLVVFAVLMIGNALKTSRAPRKRTPSDRGRFAGDRRVSRDCA